MPHRHKKAKKSKKTRINQPAKPLTIAQIYELMTDSEIHSGYSLSENDESVYVLRNGREIAEFSKRSVAFTDRHLMRKLLDYVMSNKYGLNNSKEK